MLPPCVLQASIHFGKDKGKDNHKDNHKDENSSRSSREVETPRPDAKPRFEKQSHEPVELLVSKPQRGTDRPRKTSHERDKAQKEGQGEGQEQEQEQEQGVESCAPEAGRCRAQTRVVLCIFDAAVYLKDLAGWGGGSLEGHRPPIRGPRLGV